MVATWLKMRQSARGDVMRTEIEFLMTCTDAIITVYSRKFKFFGKEVAKRYRGRRTVWRNADTGKRCSTSQELFLSDVWTKAHWDIEARHLQKILPDEPAVTAMKRPTRGGE
jgi:hypothetical protein